MHLVFECAGDAVQLPGELFEFPRTAEFQVGVPQKADGQDQENGKADSQSSEYESHKQRVEGCQGLRHSASKNRLWTEDTVARQR
jgi:hypothetical protein